MQEKTLQNNQVRIAVAVAGIAADLTNVRKVAKEISIGANNAKTIAARAGDKARGFQPISNFIDEMAKETMQLVIDIDREAHNLARTAVVEVRTHDAHNRFHAVRDIAKNAGNLASLDSPIKHLETRLNQISTTFTNHSRRLDNLLEHIVDSMRATNAISASCRVEASRAGEFRESLTVVANNFEHSVTIIKQKVMDCHKRLLDAQK